VRNPDVLGFFLSRRKIYSDVAHAGAIMSIGSSQDHQWPLSGGGGV